MNCKADSEFVGFPTSLKEKNLLGRNRLFCFTNKEDLNMAKRRKRKTAARKGHKTKRKAHKRRKATKRKTTHKKRKTTRRRKATHHAAAQVQE
jgi:hypothetical protein